MNNTQKIIRLIKRTREFEAQPYFWQEKELFQNDFDFFHLVSLLSDIFFKPFENG